TVWTKANSPYTLVGQVEVTNGAKLTLEPGVKVNGNGNDINFTWGSLESKGTQKERVTLKETHIEFGYDSVGKMDVQYTDFNNGGLVKRGTGSFVLKDSLIGARTSLYLIYTDSVIERNTFKLNYLDLTVTNENNH